MSSALDALKAKTKNALARFEDAYPKFLDEYIERSPKSPESNDSTDSESVQIEGEIASDPVIRAAIKKAKPSKKSPESSDDNSDAELIYQKQNSLMNVEIWAKKTQHSKKSVETRKAVLPEILSSLEDVNNKTIHAALNQAGFIRSGDEFIKGGM